MKKRLICCLKQQILIKFKYYIYKIKYYTKLYKLYTKLYEILV
jgi:hypothetical protein